MMRSIGFGEIWICWIKECLVTAKIAVLVNGSPMNEFSMSRGLRQGDPLSLLLFLIATEGLNGLISAAKQDGLYKGVAVGRERVVVTHLQYTDDMLLIGEACDEEVGVMKAIMRCFKAISGLKANFAKAI